jgi:phosphotransferase system enzyme I (PtsI)
METLSGLTASPGIGLGRAYIFTVPDLRYDPLQIEDPGVEKERLAGAFEGAFKELDRIKDTLSASLGEEYGHIFRAQMTILEDDDFKQEILHKLDESPCRAETAVEEVYKMYGELFSQMEDNAYNAQRLADLHDLCKRVLRNLLGREETTLSSLPPETIVVAEELFPSDTAMMDRRHIRGFVTERGGLTSHVAILAKSLSLPAAVGTPGVMDRIKKDDTVVLDVRDFERALIYVNPGEAIKKELEAEQDRYRKKQQELLEMKDLDCITRDGLRIVLSANIGSLEDLDHAQSCGAKSSGLFRTEFLFLKGDLPQEEEQYQVYAGAAKKLKGGMLIIRTLDIGGDKEVRALNLPKEANPFLGLRGIRLCFARQDLFLTQLRALLRAALHGDIRIMFPMISSVDEFRRAKELMGRAAADLKSRGIEHRADPPLGVMVETPAAVFLADEFTREASFVSMGTNDLTQYVLSVDRGNEEISAYYQTLSPAVFRAIGITAGAAVKNGKWAGICGELAGNPAALPVLIGLGVEELSVAAPAIPSTLARIRALDSRRCRDLAKKVLSLATEEEVKACLNREIQEGPDR